MISVFYDPTNSQGEFAVSIEAVAPHEHVPNPYYRLKFAQEICMILGEHECRKLMEVLGSRPQLPKSDAQIDAEREDSGYALSGGDVEVFHG